MLGAFPDTWFGGRVAVPLPFHLRARDVVAAATTAAAASPSSDARAAAAGARAAEAFFFATVAIDEPEEIARQIAAGVCERLDWKVLHPQ